MDPVLCSLLLRPTGATCCWRGGDSSGFSTESSVSPERPGPSGRQSPSPHCPGSGKRGHPFYRFQLSGPPLAPAESWAVSCRAGAQGTVHPSPGQPCALHPQDTDSWPQGGGVSQAAQPALSLLQQRCACPPGSASQRSGDAGGVARAEAPGLGRGAGAERRCSREDRGVLPTGCWPGSPSSSSRQGLQALFLRVTPIFITDVQSLRQI